MQTATAVIALLAALVNLVGLVWHCRRDKAEFRRLNDRG